MKVLALFALMMAFVRVNSNTGIVENSLSPSRQYHVESTFASDGTYFAVVGRNGRNVSPPFESDFSVLRSIESQCKLTKVTWRKDGAFLVLDSGHDRHHGDFLIIRKTNKTFELLPFNAGKLYAASKESAQFVYPEFIGWKSNGDLQIRIVGFNGFSDDCPVDFTLRLTDAVEVVSMTVGLHHKY